MSTLKKIVVALLVLVVLIPASALGYLYYKLNTMYDKEADNKILDKTDYKKEKGVTNILLAGTDGRTLDEQSRSDAMMILTVDEKNKSLKLTSLARDTYVDIPGHGMEKLTHAYAYGGINLLVETVEKNFELDIQNYAVVNFFSFMDIVDTLGGVTVDIKSNEVKEMNGFMDECYKWSGRNDGIRYIKSSGYQTLNGYQALCYGRIRKNDDALQRDRRQRELIQGLMDGVKNLPITKYPSLIDTILPYVKTNMKPTQIISLGTSVLNFGDLSLKQLEFPIEKYSTGGIVGSDGWVWQYDKSKCLPILHDFIFSDIEY
ncbi:MAG: LCP family protein [Paraclostridium sp.]